MDIAKNIRVGQVLDKLSIANQLPVEDIIEKGNKDPEGGWTEEKKKAKMLVIRFGPGRRVTNLR